MVPRRWLRAMRGSARDAPSRRSVATSRGDSEQEQAASAQPASDERRRLGQVSERNPWRHFQAFGSMDEYVDVTLIHYENEPPQNDSPPDKET